MPEYHILRAALALTEAFLFWELCKLRNVPGWMFWLMPFLMVSSLTYALPAWLDSAWWWRQVFTPFTLMRLGFTVGVTVDLYTSMTYGRVYRREQLLLGSWSIVMALLLVLASWAWSAANGIQALMVIRQYILVLLSAGSILAAVYLMLLRPIFIEGGIGPEAMLWCGFLYAECLLSGTVKHGLAWYGLAWALNVSVDEAWIGRRWYWQCVSDGCLLAQLGMMLQWVKIRHELNASRTLRVYPPGAPAVR